MKNVALGLVLAMFMALPVIAQEDQVDEPVSDDVLNDPNPTLRMGLSVSPLLSFFTMEGDPAIVSSDGVRFGIRYGLHMDFRLGSNPNYYFSTGIFMLQTGGTIRHPYVGAPKQGDPPENINREALFRLNYINIPLTFMLRTNEIGYIRYFARVGFDVGVKVRANMDINDTRENSSAAALTRDKADADDFTQLFRTALHLEAGIEYNMGGSTRLLLSAEWNSGLNNVFSSDYRQLSLDGNGNQVDGERIRGVTNVVAINLGVYF